LDSFYIALHILNEGENKQQQQQQQQQQQKQQKDNVEDFKATHYHHCYFALALTTSQDS